MKIEPGPTAVNFSVRSGATNNVYGGSPAEVESRGSVLPMLILSLIFLGAAHLSVREFFPSPAFWIVGASIILTVSVAWIIARRSYFEVLLAFFACAHFAFADTQGGLWSYIFCAVLLVGALVRSPDIRPSSVPRYVNVLIAVLVVHQILGMMLNSYLFVSNVQASVIFSSYILVFYVSASQTLTKPRLRQLLTTWFVLAFYCFLVGLNQRYHWIVTASPLVPHLVYREGLVATTVTVPAGPFKNAELFGEYFSMVFAFSLVMFTYSKELVSLRIKRIFPLLMIVLSSAAIVMGAARAAVILASIVIVFLLLFNLFVLGTGKAIKRALVLVLVVCLAVGIIAGLRSSLFVGEMTKKMSLLRPSEVTIENILSGKSIHRGELIEAGLRRLNQASWWIGYGYNIPENNHRSLGLSIGSAKDFHNLYLAIPMYFGWLGAAAYILLIAGSIARVSLAYFRQRHRSSPYLPVALGLAIIGVVFLLDEYKIDVTRNPNYWFMTWMLLGWMHSVANALSPVRSRTRPPGGQRERDGVAPAA